MTGPERGKQPMHGSFFWYDVMTTDTKAAQKFYTEVIGWGVQPAGPD